MKEMKEVKEATETDRLHIVVLKKHLQNLLALFHNALHD